ncbi:MAG: hypothetical protein ABIO99_05830 [Candidatus Limnocylindria bacterium]
MTPGRLVLLVALLGSALVAAYGLFLDRTGGTIIFTVVGLLILGIVLAILAIMFARASMRAGWSGRGGRSVGAALLGGICALMASGSLGAAAIFGLLRAS